MNEDSNIQATLEKIKNEIDEFENLPDNLKVGEKYTNLMIEINQISTIIDKYIDTIEQPITEKSSDICTDDEFKISMDKFEKLNNLFNDTQNIETKIKLFSEITEIGTKCKNYLENKKMEIEYV